MQVKIDLNSFTGHAELSAGELDVLVKILPKFFGTDQRYLGNRYVETHNGRKISVKLEMALGTEFMTESQFLAEKEQFDAAEATKAEKQRKDRQRASFAVAVEETDAAKDALVECLINQSLLYWQEKPENNPIHDWRIAGDVVSFVAGDPQNTCRIVIRSDGTFERTVA